MRGRDTTKELRRIENFLDRVESEILPYEPVSLADAMNYVSLLRNVEAQLGGIARELYDYIDSYLAKYGLEPSDIGVYPYTGNQSSGEGIIVPSLSMPVMSRQLQPLQVSAAVSQIVSPRVIVSGGGQVAVPRMLGRLLPLVIGYGRSRAPIVRSRGEVIVV